VRGKKLDAIWQEASQKDAERAFGFLRKTDRLGINILNHISDESLILKDYSSFHWVLNDCQ
jgi:hypothetical protein